MDLVSQVEKKTLLQAFCDVFEFIYVAVLNYQRQSISVTWFGNVNPIPFHQLIHECMLSKGVRRWFRID